MSPPIDRRTTLKWMLTAAATLPVLGLPGCGSDPAPATPGTGGTSPASKTPGSQGYGTDPVLAKQYARGDVWPLTMTQAQRGTAVVLARLIVPADADGPGAVEVGVVDFLDEWISAPYPVQVEDRKTVLEGFDWIDAEAKRRFGKGSFAVLTEAQQTEICDAICYLPKAKPEHEQAARFFARYRDLTIGAFCTSPQGRQYMRYIGNTPMANFDGPPPEVMKRVGVGA